MEIYCFTSHRSFVCPICCFVSVRSPRLSCRRSNTRRWPNVGLLLAHRLWRSASISPVLGYRVVFDATLNVGQRHRRPANINPALVQSIVTVPPTFIYVACDRPGRHEAFARCWYSVGPQSAAQTYILGGSALCRHWVDVYLVLLW